LSNPEEGLSFREFFIAHDVFAAAVDAEGYLRSQAFEDSGGFFSGRFGDPFVYVASGNQNAQAF
jgi:hypothetical protein